METLREFCNILLGYKIEVFTDHKNLTYEKEISDSQMLQRWCSLLNEFDLTLNFMEGDANIVADALSRLPMVAHSQPLSTETAEADLCTLLQLSELHVTNTAVDCFSTDEDEINYPLTPQLVGGNKSESSTQTRSRQKE